MMCLRSYKKKGGLTQHQRYECGKQPRFACPVLNCLFKSKMKGNLGAHVRKVHKIGFGSKDIKVLYDSCS